MFSEEKLLLYLVCSIGFLFLVLSYRKITDKTLKATPFNIILILIAGTSMAINNLYNQSFFKTITGFLIFMITFYLMYRDTLKKSFILTFFVWIVGMIVDITVGVILSKIGFLALKFVDLKTLKIVTTLIPSILIFLIISIKNIKTKLINIQMYLNDKTYDFPATILIMLIISLLGALSVIDVGKYNTENFIIIVLILLFALISYILKIRNDQFILKIKNDSLSKTNALYISMSKKFRELKHNSVAHFMAIRSIANEETKKLIDDRLDYFRSSYDFISNIEVAPDGIKDILYIKLANVEKNYHRINIENSAPEDIISRLKSRNYNMICETLTLALDNAIEAISNSKEKVINIDISNDEENLYIIIVNTFSDTVDIDELGNSNYTTKEEGNGIGLNSILENKYVKSKTSILGNKFKLELKVKLKKELR